MSLYSTDTGAIRTRRTENAVLVYICTLKLALLTAEDSTDSTNLLSQAKASHRKMSFFVSYQCQHYELTVVYGYFWCQKGKNSPQIKFIME